jgi:NAD(P)-dependent dehydrogenase (short-subunit alcohol dehydrogenase family)
LIQPLRRSNAEIASSAAIEDTSLELWDRNYSVLAQGHFLTSRAAWPLLKRMKAQGGSSVVFIGSKNGVAAATNASAYASAKAAAMGRWPGWHTICKIPNPR